MSDFKLRKLRYSFADINTSGGMVTLLAGSAQDQNFYGTMDHTVRLPDATTMSTGLLFAVKNNSTGTIAVQNHSGVVIGSVASGNAAEFFLEENNTANGQWTTYASGSSGAGGPGSGTPLLKSSSSLGLIGGGWNGNMLLSTIDFVYIAKDSTSEQFGTLTVARRAVNGNAGSNTRALFGGGYDGGNSNVIDFIEYATGGTAQDFGDLTVPRQYAGATSNKVRAVWGGGYNISGPNVGTMDYVTIASPANAGAWGSLSVTRGQVNSLSSPIRGFYCGGFISSGNNSNVIDFTVFATIASATDWGDLTYTPSSGCSGSNSRKGVVAGGYTYAANNYVSTMNHFNLGTLGNASTFGNLAQGIRGEMCPLSNQNRFLLAGGDPITKNIEKCMFDSEGSTSNFGSLRSNLFAGMGASNSHGGVQ